MSQVTPVGDRTDVEHGSVKTVKPKLQGHTPVAKKVISKEKKEKADKFEAFIKSLGTKIKPEEKRIDFVLVHDLVDPEEQKDWDEDDQKEFIRTEMLREKFEEAMKEEGLQKQKVQIDNRMYTKVHCPFKRMCMEAETVSLEMPLQGTESEHKDDGCCNDIITRKFGTDNEVDLVSAPFRMDHMIIYDKFDDPTYFFRPAMRSLLVEHILRHIDLRESGDGASYGQSKRSAKRRNAKSCSNCWGCLKKEEEDDLGDMQIVGLNYMMMESVYAESFVLHEESSFDPDMDKKTKKNLPVTPEILAQDPRFAMQITWTKIFKFQPLWKIRNYFGEKIAFYFAWLGMLITSLWVPMLFGFACFLYGLIITLDSTASKYESTGNSSLTGIFNDMKECFDNDSTPYYALFISIWGTLFMEAWKRKQATLAYQWDVDQFEENEPDRPQFYGTKQRLDPVTNILDWYYPVTRRAWKILLSAMTLLSMVLMVLISVVAVVAYRVFVTVDYCPGKSAGDCLFVTTILSSLFNAISIVILGKVYDIIAYKLTEWENHRTETAYNDALVIKLFGFQFANNYTSCFYIAFFRGRYDDDGIFNQGTKYQDNCDGTCMSQLSFQVMILMVTKPVVKFLMDIVLPWVMWHVRRKCQCMTCIPFLKNILKYNPKPKEEMTLLEIESEKPSLGNFTLAEYTEKCIMYGLMMLFAASFPLAPFLALIIYMADMRIDAYRMLWIYQRPSAIIVEDIGTWFAILTFLNYAGVVSNAFLIAYTASWGTNYDSTEKLWIVIGFEHIVFAMKFLLGYLIPDEPATVKLARRKKQYQLSKKLEDVDIQREEIIRSLITNKPQDQNSSSRKEPELVKGPLIFSRRGEPAKKFFSGNEFSSEDETAVRKLKRRPQSGEKTNGGTASPNGQSGRLKPGKTDRQGSQALDWLKV